MEDCLAITALLMFLTEYVTSMKCAECDYLPHTAISGIRTCPENCNGEICFIVVNNYYNETLVSGCVNVDKDTRAFFHGHAYCYRKRRYTVCGCTTLDRCNSPQAPFSMFTFITTPFFEDCELVPKYEDEESNSFQFNVTLEGNKHKTELIEKKTEITEGAESANSILEAESSRTTYVMQLGTGTNANAEAIVQTAHIGEPPSIVTEPMTPHPTVTYPINNIEPINDNSDEISSEFMDELMRNLLPSTAHQFVTHPEEESHEKAKMVYGGSGRSIQCKPCRTILLSIIALVHYSYY